jgi:hypothetical protein
MWQIRSCSTKNIVATKKEGIERGRLTTRTTKRRVKVTSRFGNDFTARQ